MVGDCTDSGPEKQSWRSERRRGAGIRQNGTVAPQTRGRHRRADGWAFTGPHADVALWAGNGCSPLGQGIQSGSGRRQAISQSVSPTPARRSRSAISVRYGSAPPRPVRAPCRVCRSRDPAYARYSMAFRTPMPVSSYPCPRSPTALLAVLSLCEDSPPRAQQGARRSASGNMSGALRAQT